MKRYFFLLTIIIIFLSSCSLLPVQDTKENERLDNIESELASLKLTLSNHEKSFENINASINQVNKKIEDISSSLELLKTELNKVSYTLASSNTKTQEILQNYNNELNIINNSLNNIKKEITMLKKRKDDEFYTQFLTALENRIKNIESNLHILNNDTIKKADLISLTENFITKDSTIFENNKNYVDLKFNTINKKINTSLNSINNKLFSLESSLTNVQDSLNSKYNDFLNFKEYNNDNFDSINNKIKNLDIQLNTLKTDNNKLYKDLIDLRDNLYKITLSSTEIKNSIDKSVKTNIDDLLKTINSLDKIWQINFETLENDLDSLKNDYSTFKKQTIGLINEKNLKKYVYESVETETQREVAKLFYKTKSDELLKIKELEEKFKILDKTIGNLQNSFELLSSRPLSTFDEKYKTKLEELERELTNALISFSNAEIKELFGSGDQIIYTVKSGDTLSQIALAFGLGYNGVDLIKVANNIDDPRTIRIGQKIIIPVNNIENFLTWPLSYTSPSDYDRIVIRFGDRISTGVSVGLGILPLKNESVKPALPGRIIDVGKAPNKSFYVKIDHGNGVVSIYSNLTSINIKNGQWVDKDTILGTIKKDTLFNFEIWKNGEPKDPMKLFFKYLGDFKATFYTEWDDKIIYYPAFRLTKSQNVPRPWVTVAADPELIPLGTVVYIPEFRNSPNFGFFEIEDIGSKIVGNRLDIYINDVRLAQKTQNVSVYIVGEKNRR
ncbi:LysM peptidoglycan-binding domain-containing protein [Marinitoga hydrogenitolerans]|nr:LysM peptidoglycan-binding domain-containing protein [Marinitoga hydrogenitolerans]